MAEICSNVFNKNKYYDKLLGLYDSECKSGCSINIPELNVKAKYSYHIDFQNKSKFFKEASFQVNKIVGNNWRIGIKLLDIDGTDEIFVIHPYINKPDQNYLGFRLLNKERNNKIDRKFNYKINPSEFFKYKIVFSENTISCFINNLKIEEVNGITVYEDNFHSVRFHLWGKYSNSDLYLEITNLEIIWN